MDSKTDAYLVRMARSGDRDAYGELIRRYQRQIWGLACILLDDRFEAEDVTQEAFLRAWLNLDEAVELRQRIWDAVGRLPPRYRLPVTLFHLDGLSHSKVAEALRVPVSTVRSLVTRARQKLQPMLASLCWGIPPGFGRCVQRTGD